MKAVKNLERAASGHAEFSVDGQRYYFPREMAGFVVAVEVVAEAPRTPAQHSVQGPLVRRGNYAELVDGTGKFYFPLPMAGQYAMIDVISPVHQSAPATPPATALNMIDQVRAGATLGSLQAKTTDDPSRGPDVNATQGTVRIHTDADLEVLG